MQSTGDDCVLASGLLASVQEKKICLFGSQLRRKHKTRELSFIAGFPRKIRFATQRNSSEKVSASWSLKSRNVCVCGRLR